jgi:NDP-sugar pyrophosphorylase family protein
LKIDSILILAAGKGTRLKPYTDDLPKSLLPLGATHILRQLIVQSEKYFSSAKIYVNASYLAEKIINEVTNFPIARRPYVVWEQYPLGPAFTVTNHCNENSGNVLVLHGDNFFTDLTFSEFANSIHQKKHDVSILLCHQRSKSTARSIVIEKDGIIQSITEISDSDRTNGLYENDKSEFIWCSSGAIVIKRKSLINFTAQNAVSLSPSLINYIASKEDLYLEKCTGTRISIDSEKSYLAAVEISKKSQNLFN